MKVARTAFSLVGLVALFTLIVSQGHRPGDVPSAVVGLGVIVAALGVILRIVQATSHRPIHVFGSRPGDSLERYANSRQAVTLTIAGGIVAAVIGVLFALLFPTL